MSSKPLVPSKDALRLLRSLANSSPVTLIAAASSFCGAVSIHCHERRKLCRAQKILETKRKLHSISKGRGSTRLALMFDAAERGEDFTINGCEKTKISKRSQHSLLAAKNESEDADRHSLTREPDKDTEITSPGEACLKGSIRRHVLNNSGSIQHQGATSVSSRETHRGSRRHTKTPRIDNRYPWRATLIKSLQRTRPTQFVVTDDMAQSPDTKPLNPLIKSRVDQPLTDLSPPSSISDGMLDHKAQKEKIATTKSDSILLKLDLMKSPPDNALSSLQPWHLDLRTQDTVDMDQNESASVSLKPEFPNLYLAPSAHVPPIDTKHCFESRYDLSNDRIKSGMSLIGPERYFHVYTSLMNYQQHNGKRQALALLEDTMERYTRTSKRADWALVQALFLDCVRTFSSHELRPLVFRFVRKFLHGGMPRLEAVSLLYPQCGAGATTVKQYYYYPAHQYLESLAVDGSSLEQQVDELRKVLAGTHMCGIRPHEHLIIPALQSYCSAGRMTSAQALFDEMTSQHKIPTTFYSLKVLVKGYARIGNWAKVKLILDECYMDGLSVQKPYALSGLLHLVISDYSVSQSPEKVVDFVLHCIKQYRIEPVSGITAEIISLCLRQHRYDLAADWTEMIRTDFPHVDTGFGSNTFAFKMSSIWKQMEASCEEILEGCRALATMAVRDPFSRVFRSAISEAVSRYLTPRLEMLRTELGSDIPGLVDSEIHEFYTALKQVKDWAPTKRWDSRTRLVLADLRRQAESLRWLNALCHGHTDLQGANVPRRTRFQDQVKTEIQEVQLPHITQLGDVVMKEYVQRDKIGQPIDHNRLREFVLQLVRQGRLPDAYSLIQTVHESCWVQPPQGKDFDIDLFTQWLKLAWDLKSGTKVRHVLWAVVDAGPQLELNSQIILLARIAAPQAHMERNKSAKPPHLEEVEYLRHRLRRRHHITNSGQLRIASWKGFGSVDHRL